MPVMTASRPYRMGPSMRMLLPVVLLSLLPGALGALEADAAPGTLTQALRAQAHSPLKSRRLWATVDACDPKGHPNTIGIRGSMPGDGHPTSTMYMRFRVQYLDGTTNKWIDVGKGGDSGFVKLGSAQLTREGGRSFQFMPVVGQPAFTMRGTVSFQWRQGATVVYGANRVTAAGHISGAGAEPPGFSAASCKLA